MNKNQISGKIDEVKGKIKEATGIAIDNKEMEIKGMAQKNSGKAEQLAGDIKEAVKEKL